MQAVALYIGETIHVQLIMKQFYKTFTFLTLVYYFLHVGSHESHHNRDNQEVCVQQDRDVDFVVVRDSVNPLFKEFDTDDTDYWIIDEMIPCIRKYSDFAMGDAEVVEKANKYLSYLDDNADGVVDIYELRLNLLFISSSSAQESLIKFGGDNGFILWLSSFTGDSPQKYPFYLIKIFQLFDEDLNGKLTWKEIRMTIKLAELFGNVTELQLMDERAREDLVATIKLKYQQKWLNMEELWTLLNQLDIKSDAVFYHWVRNFLGGNTELESDLVLDSTRTEFMNIDTDSNQVITKGELIAVLHAHRKNYYTDQRINRKWTRADRNQDGKITFNEYAFLEELKHPQRK